MFSKKTIIIVVAVVIVSIAIYLLTRKKGSETVEYLDEKRNEPSQGQAPKTGIAGNITIKTPTNNQLFLKKGDKNNNVAKYQAFINMMSFPLKLRYVDVPILEVDGNWGSNTQKSHELMIKGINQMGKNPQGLTNAGITKPFFDKYVIENQSMFQ